MKAALFEAIGKLRMTEVDVPTLGGPDEVLIKVGAVGVCGSEIHAFKGTHPFRRPPAVMGHEVAGEIVEAGTGVRDFAEGDRVFVDPQWTCGACEWCRSGRRNLCPEKTVLGTPGWSGGLGEYMVAPEQSLYRLRDDVSDVTATLIEPLSVGVHAVDRAGLQAGESVAVLGTGPIGMVTAAMCQVRGALPIVAVDMQPHCLAVAKTHMGATHTLNAGEGRVVERALEITGGRGFDVVFLTVGVAALVGDALKMVERAGRVVFVALFDEPVRFEAFEIVGRDVSFVGSQMYDDGDIRTAADLVLSGRVAVDAMVTHVLPLEEAQRGFELVATKAEGAIKAVLTFGDDQ